LKTSNNSQCDWEEKLQKKNFVDLSQKQASTWCEFIVPNSMASFQPTLAREGTAHQLSFVNCLCTLNLGQMQWSFGFG